VRTDIHHAGKANQMNIKERSEFGKITIEDLFEALGGIPLGTEVTISHDDRKYSIQGVYYETQPPNQPVELEIGVWRNE
jgi:hypothetical protein